MALSLPIRQLHIAVLECESFPSAITKTYGTFTDIFHRWLNAGITRLNSTTKYHVKARIHTTSWQVRTGSYPPDLNSVDALVITGSLCSVNDDIPWIKTLRSFLQYVYKTHPRVKIFGSCFGHQMVGKALLSERFQVHVEQSRCGWEIGVYTVRHNSEFTKHFPCVQGKLMQYQFIHSEEIVVNRLPPGWISMGVTEKCAVQGLFEPGRVLTYQGHPEFDENIVDVLLQVLYKNGSIDLETHDEALSLLDRYSTSTLAAEVAARFLLWK
ncbi:class I glutamine amidotransferase-like protein [Xylariales sp. PMI_506]|nr:class I glutamine amidotransferase-like protein [Xylariales sp. PMI_506]